MPENIVIGLTFSAAAGAAVEGIKTLGGAVEGMKGRTETAARVHLKLGDAIKKGTAAGRDVSALSTQYARLGSSIEKAQVSARKFREAQGNISRHRAAIGSMWGEMMGTVGLGMTLAAPVKLAADFESAMADVSKVLDEPDEKIARLGGTIMAMTRTMPLAATELAAIAASGGQLGIAFDDLADSTDASGKKVDGFISTVAKMATAFDMSAGETGDAMAKLKNIYGFETREMTQVGDMINKFADSGIATAGSTINALTRLGTNAKDFGLNVMQVGAWSNVIASLAPNIENGTTAFNGLMTQMTLAAAGALPEKTVDALASIGVSAQSLRKDIEQDANGALLKLIERLKEVDKFKRSEVITALAGAGDVKNLAFLFDKGLDVYRQSMSVIEQSSGSMDAEFQKRSATTANNLRLLKNHVNELGITVGSVLLPPLNRTINSMKPVLESVITFSRAHPELIGNIGKAAAVLLAFKAGSLGVGFVYHTLGTAVWGAVLPFRAFNRALAFAGLARQTGAAVSALGSSMTALEGGAAAAGGAVPRLGAAVGTTGATAGRAAGLFGRFGSMLGWIGRGVVMVGGAVAGISAPVWGVIVVVGAALAAAGLLVYKYWQPISHFFSGFWKGFKAGVAPLGGLFKQVFAPMAPLVRPLVSALGSLWEWIKPLGGWFKGLLKPVEDTGTGITELGESVGRFVGQCVAKFAEWQTFMLRLPAQFMEIGGDIIGGLVKGITGKLGEAKEAITGVGSSIKGWFTSTLGISSPSRVFMRFGAFLDEGLAMGITNSLGAVTGAAGRLSAAAVPRLPDLGAAFQSAPPRLPEAGGAARPALPSPPKFPDLGGLLHGIMPSMPALPGLSGPPAVPGARPNPLANLPRLPNTGNTGRTVNSAFHFNPTINLPAAASAGDIAGQVRGAVETGFEEFRKQMRRYEQEMGRRAFGGAV